MDRSALFNNAGVLLLERGYDKIAAELFRGALESKLACERGLNHSGPKQAQISALERCVNPGSIETAENHLANMDTYIERTPMQEEYLTSSEPDDSDCFAPAVPLESRGYNPFIYLQPFELPNTSSTSTQLTSAIIVFNLGLVHHYASRNSPKTAAFYEIAAALLSSDLDLMRSSLLRIAIINNFGVWCYENAEGESTRMCMEHLSRIIDASCTTMSTVVQEGIRLNIQWLLTPPTGGSPAA